MFMCGNNSPSHDMDDNDYDLFVSYQSKYFKIFYIV